MSSAGSQPKRKQVTPLPLMGIGQIAEWLGVGERHVRRLISERRIPYVKWGHYIRFDPVQVDEWLRSNRIAPTRTSGQKSGAGPWYGHAGSSPDENGEQAHVPLPTLGGVTAPEEVS